MIADNQKAVVIFGAGKIARTFIGPIFAQNGYLPIFLEVNSDLVAALKSQGYYTLITLLDDGTTRSQRITFMQVLDTHDHEQMLTICTKVSLVVTSVGANALPFVAKQLSEIAEHRFSKGLPPLDCILAENMRNGKAVMHSYLTRHIPPKIMPSLIPASVGKTAPEIPDALAKAEDPLAVCGDSYSTLTVSAKGWHHPPPRFPQLELVPIIEAYLDRKIFIHNLAHVAFAYWGYCYNPHFLTIRQAIDANTVRDKVELMIEYVIQALSLRWPTEFSPTSLTSYFKGAFARMSNPTLQDTLFRIGRDIARKLGPEERIVGAMRLLAQSKLPLDMLVDLYCSALSFQSRDSKGELDPLDLQFHAHLKAKGVEHAVYQISRFDSGRDKHIIAAIIAQYDANYDNN